MQKLHDSNIAWVPIIDPGILVDPEYDAYNKGMAADIFIKLGAWEAYTGQASYLSDFMLDMKYLPLNGGKC